MFWQDGGKWQSRIVGSAPTEEQSKAIDGLGNPWPGDLVPRKAVSVGDSWTQDGERLREWFGISEEAFSGVLKVYFEKVVEYKDEQCALLSIQFDISGDAILPDGEPLSINVSGEGFIYRSLAKKIDIYSEIRGDGRWDASYFDAGQEMQLTVTGPFVAEEQVFKD